MSFQSPSPLRKLAPALALSILLHSLLLWPDPESPAGGDAARPLIATLRSRGATAPHEIHRPTPRTAVSTPHAILSVAASDVPTVAVATATPSDITPDSTAEFARRSDELAPPGPGPGGAAPRSAPAAAAAGTGPDAEGVRQYRLALAVEARRYRRYPAAAMAANMGGTAEIRIVVGVGGLEPEVVLLRSSGYDLLDDAALDMMKRAAPRTLVPERLRGRSFVVSLPVVFDLDAE